MFRENSSTLRTRNVVSRHLQWGWQISGHARTPGGLELAVKGTRVVGSPTFSLPCRPAALPPYAPVSQQAPLLLPPPQALQQGNVLAPDELQRPQGVHRVRNLLRVVLLLLQLTLRALQPAAGLVQLRLPGGIVIVPGLLRG